MRKRAPNGVTIRALLLRLPADPRELEAVWLASYRGRLRIIGPRLEQFLRGPS